MSKLGEDLIRSAEEALAIAKGEAEPGSYNVYVPQDIDVAEIRTALDLTQAEFAHRFGFSLASVRDWEQNRRRPEKSARVLLMVIRHNPDMVDEALRANDPTLAVA
jgi:putative transcriptional regulator